MAIKAQRIISFALIAIVFSSATAVASRVGVLLEPKTIAQLVWDEENLSFLRIEIESVTKISVAPSNCQFLQEARVEQEIREQAPNQIKICSDVPLIAGSEYLVALYPATSLPLAMITEIERISNVDMSDRQSHFILKPLWAFPVNTIRHRERDAEKFVVIPAPYLSGAEKCTARTERVVVEFSDDPEESGSSKLHLDWKCFVSEAMENKPQDNS